MSTNLQLTPGSLPTGYCWPSTPQEFLNDAMAISSAVFTGELTVFNYGDSTPSADNQVYPWIRTVSGYPDRLYVYYGGQWLAKHPVPSGTGIRQMWVGTTTELLTYDGGVNEAVGTNGWTGPFWEVDTNFAARIPIGPGTLTASGTVVSVDQNYGNEQHTLTEAQMPSHSHSPPSGSGITSFLTYSNTAAGVYDIQSGTPNMALSAATADAGSDEPFNLLPQVRGVYMIKRTARLYYRA